MKKIIFLMIGIIIGLQPQVVYSMPCCKGYSVYYDYVPPDLDVLCHLECNVSSTYTGYSSALTIVETAGNCPGVCEVMCYDMSVQYGGFPGCSYSGGSSYGGCMGGGYTTGGKPVPAPGKVIKSLVVPGQ